MTETGLIIAEVVFLVLLYAFVWAIVRSASRQLSGSPTPPPPPPAAAAAPDGAAPRAAPARHGRRPGRRGRGPGRAAPAAAAGADPRARAGARRRPRHLRGPHRGERGRRARSTWPRTSTRAWWWSRRRRCRPGARCPLGGGITIGRSEAADISISDQFVSHMHARVTRRGAYHFVVDLGSTNGTFLNDRRIESDAQLKVHDSLRIGQSILRYEE